MLTVWNEAYYKPTPPKPPKPLAKPKESAARDKVLEQVEAGLCTTVEISESLGISINAARKHLHRLVIKGLVISCQKRNAVGNAIIYKVKQ